MKQLITIVLTCFVALLCSLGHGLADRPSTFAAGMAPPGKSMLMPTTGSAGQDKGPVPWAELGKRAGEQYRGDGLAVAATRDGAHLQCVFQKLEGELGPDALQVISKASSKAGRFAIRASDLGRTGSPGAKISSGKVSVEGEVARLVRPNLVEELSVSADGIRQDFVIPEAPAGTDELRLGLSIEGARVQSAGANARLLIKGSGRVLSYSRLLVTDAQGRQLPARLEVESPTRLAVLVTDTNARYPLRIDPTICDDNWVSMRVTPGMEGPVYALAVDGAGNLYAGGDFDSGGGVLTGCIARLNGSNWMSLGSGVLLVASTLAADATGNLYAGLADWLGRATENNIAKWDGTNWRPLGLGMNGIVYALAVDGAGNLYAGGDFTTAGGIAANRIAKWDGTNWSSLGTGMNNYVEALAVDGAGNLYAGGWFTTAGSIAANYSF